MPLISPTIELALEEGELKGEQKLAIKLLNQHFGEIEQPLIQKIRELPGEQLEELTDILLTLGNVIDKGKMAKQ
jgi:hypothetical protein